MYEDFLSPEERYNKPNSDAFLWVDIWRTYELLTTYYGYNKDHIYVLCGNGNFIKKDKALFSEPNTPNNVEQSESIPNLEDTFNKLNETMDDKSSLFILVAAHGYYSSYNDNSFFKIRTEKDDTSTSLYLDSEAFRTRYVDKVTNYKQMIFLMLPCESGGYIDDLDGDKMVVITGSDKEHTSKSCDDPDIPDVSYFGCGPASDPSWYPTIGLDDDGGGLIDNEKCCCEVEFHFYNAVQNRVGIAPNCFVVDPDGDNDGYISIYEAYQYIIQMDSWTPENLAHTSHSAFDYAYDNPLYGSTFPDFGKNVYL